MTEPVELLRSSFRRSFPLLLSFGLGLVAPRLTANPPAAPANVRAITLPAEVLLTWDGTPDVAYYAIYRADMDRRWMPIATGVMSPRYRDTEFRSLPCYYQIVAYNAGNELAATPEFIVSNRVASIVLYGVNPRPVSDTAVAFAWNMSGPGDGLLEIGAAPGNFQWSFPSANLAPRQEFVVGNLAPSTTYYFRLTSSDSNGGGLSYWNSFTTRPFTAPPPTTVRIPTADGQPITITSDEDVPSRLALTANNPSGAALNYFVVTQPYPGASLTGTDRDLVYLPKPEGFGPDTFVVGVTDGFVTNTTRVNMDIRFVHDPPITLDQSLACNEDSGIKFQVLATTMDVDPADLTYLLANGPTNGVITHWPGDPPSWWQYTPNTNFNGIDHFTYAATDGQTTGNVANVRVRVLPINDAPVPLNQSLIVSRTAPANIALSASDPDGDQIVYTVLAPPTVGTLSGATPNFTGQLLYTPISTSTNNTDSFTYRVSDGTLSATATITITLLPLYYPPIASNAVVNTDSNQPTSITLSGTAVYGNPLTYTLLSAPIHGKLTGTPPNLLYTPWSFIGTDSFTFKVFDSYAFGSPGTVTINLLKPTAPRAPSALTAITIANRQIDLYWTDNSWNETGFQIERSDDGIKFRLIGTVGPNVTVYPSLKLSSGRKYYYRVRAYNKIGTSSYSNVAWAKTA